MQEDDVGIQTCAFPFLRSKILAQRKKSDAARLAVPQPPFLDGALHAVASELSDNAQSAGNAAMEELRNLQPVAKGGTPITDTDTTTVWGTHVQGMLAACLGSCAAGTTLGFTSAATAAIERESWYNPSAGDYWLTDALLLGATGGALLSSLPLWFLGSRTTMLLCAVGLTASWLLLAFSTHIVAFFVARVLCGAWLGLTTIGISLYVSEVAPPEKRAFYTGLTEVATSTGIVASYALTGFSWRLQASVWSLAPLGLLGAQGVLVESPRWLLLRGRRHDADTAAARLYGYALPPQFKQSNKSPGEAAMTTMQYAVQAKRLSACLVLHLLQGSTCAQLFLYRGTQVMEGLVAPVAAPLAAAAITTVHAGFVVTFAFVTRIAGRRLLLCVSTMLVASCFCIFPPFEHLVLRQGSAPGDTSWQAVYSVILVVFSYSVGLCHLPPLLTAELCSGPGLLHHVGASVTWTFRWMLAFLLLHFDRELLTVARAINAPLTLSMALITIGGGLVAFLPEREGRTLPAIESGE